MTEAARVLAGKICVVTGGTGGIGLATARRLCGMGAEVAIVGRNPERGAAARAAVAAAGTGPVEFLRADLSDLDQVRELARTLISRHPKIHVLVNNAGAVFRRRQFSAQGLEMTFALNHLGPFLLTLLLLPALKAAAPARIVNVSSIAHRFYPLDFGDLQSEQGYRAWRAYGRSKLANLLFTRELARRLNPSVVTVNALHPGFVATGLFTRHDALPSLLSWLCTRFALSPERGADTPVFLASAPGAGESHGGYFERCRSARPASVALDAEAAARLWRESLRLTGCAELPVAGGENPEPEWTRF